jgi:hypothetical protein
MTKEYNFLDNKKARDMPEQTEEATSFLLKTSKMIIV